MKIDISKAFDTLSWEFIIQLLIDHAPCIVQIGTSIPKSNIFIFENYWLKIPGFQDTVKSIWEQEVQANTSAKRITTKFKRLRKGLKIWSKSISQLSMLIKNSNKLVLFFDILEEFRELSTKEWNGRNIIKQHLKNLLSYKNIYWKQRATIRWVKFGDENTDFFQAKATIKY